MLDKNKQIWFIGIKGTGMASLALLLHDLGYDVAGSDIEKYTFTQVPLESVGMDVKNFNPNNTKSNDEQVIVKGNAFKEDNPEVKACLKRVLSGKATQILLKKSCKCTLQSVFQVLTARLQPLVFCHTF